MKHFPLTFLAALLTACSSPDTSVPVEKPEIEKPQYSLDQAGEDFVKIALRMGEIDSDYVDAYSGPKAWREAIQGSKVDADALAEEISDLRLRINEIEGADNIRKQNLIKLLRAMAVRLDVVTGEAVSFDKEVSDIYDVKPVSYTHLTLPTILLV